MARTDRDRRYYAANRERILAAKRDRYAMNADIFRARVQAYRDRDGDLIGEANFLDVSMAEMRAIAAEDRA